MKNLNGQRLVTNRGRHDHGHVSATRRQMSQHDRSVHVRQMVVQQQDVILPALQPGETFLPGAHDIELELRSMRVEVRPGQIDVEHVVFRVEHTQRCDEILIGHWSVGTAVRW